MGYGRNELRLQPAELLGFLARGPLVDDLLLEPEAAQGQGQLGGQGPEQLQVLPGEPFARSLAADEDPARGGPPLGREGQSEIVAGGRENVRPPEVQAPGVLDAPLRGPDDRLAGPSVEQRGDSLVIEPAAPDDLGRRRRHPGKKGQAADSLHRKSLVQGVLQEPGELILAQGALGRRGEPGDRPPVVVALPEKGPVHEGLDPLAGRGEKSRRDKGRGRGDAAPPRPGPPDEDLLQDLGGQKIDADRDRGQERVHEAAVEEDVDVHQPVLDDGDGQEERQEDEQVCPGFLSDQRGKIHGLGDLVEDQEGAEAREKAG